ncbi:MAG: chromate transporter, partial [Chloroflexi bacterium]|nr:chromate transporter [Chloroflexota bacterium]
MRESGFPTDAAGDDLVPFREGVRTWIRVGLLSFGGPAGQIAVMHRSLVEEKRWLSEPQFLRALNYCMLLPGPEAQQLAIYSGWLLHGYRGGLVAGWFFVIPGFLAILALSIAYAVYLDITFVSALFFGLKAAVLAIVVEAVVRIGRRALRRRVSYLIAAGSFIAIFFLTLPFPAIIAGAATVGFIGARWAPRLFGVAQVASGSDEDEAAGERQTRATAAPVGRAIRITLLWGTLWLLPTATLMAIAGP